MTSNSSDPVLTVLKSWPFGSGSELPYRMEYLEEHGLQLRWKDTDPAGQLLRRAEAVTVPFAQTLALARTIAASDMVLAMFESEGNFLAAYRRLVPGGRDRPFYAVMTCWLAHLLSSAGRTRRRGYRWAYRSVDRLFYLSRNQGPLLVEELGGDPERFCYVPFGVDADTFGPAGEDDDDYVLVVGRDKGRDWPTLLQALDGIGLPVKVLCRPADLAGLRVPEGVDVLGYVDRSSYRDLLGRARVVAIASRPVVYPSGQSVLLEAMSMGRCSVVTRTEALDDYVTDGVTALAVPPGDPGALQDEIVRAAADDDLRARIGLGGRAAVERTFNARAMWGAVATQLLALLDRRG